MFTIISKTIRPTQQKQKKQNFCVPEKKKKCKNNHDIVKIVKHVYVSDFGSARCKKTLKNENIKWILDLKESRKKTDLLASSSSSSYSKVENTRRLGKFRYKHISAKDEPDYPLEKHFETAIEFITFAVEREENVLVHCNMGVSRSVSVVIAFLMYHQRISYKHAKRVVCLKRRESRPNSGFEKQLKKFKDRRVSFSSSSSYGSSSPSSSDSDSRSNSS